MYWVAFISILPKVEIPVALNVPDIVRSAFGVDVPIPTLLVNPLLKISPLVFADQWLVPPAATFQTALPETSEVNTKSGA